MVSGNKVRIAAVLLAAVLLGGCADRVPVPQETPPETMETMAEENGISLAERLAGIYRGESEENGETILQMYRIGGMLIAEVQEEYAAYHAAELIPADPEILTDPEASEAAVTAYRFSGFSADGAYWEDPETVTVALTESGLTWTEADGSVMEYTRTDSAEPIHTAARYEELPEAFPVPSYDPALTGRWEAEADGCRMILRLDEDGTLCWFSKKEGEPVSVHIGVWYIETDSGCLVTVTEKVGWAQMPWMNRTVCTETDKGLLLKNEEAEGLLPTDGTVEFVRPAGN